MPHKGAKRGNSINSAAMMGAPSSISRPAVLMGTLSGGLPAGICALTTAASSPHSPSNMASASAKLCPNKKWVMMMKKPKKNTTKASRRARSSRVFRQSSTTARVTPPSRPAKVLWLTQVPSMAAANSATRQAKPGKGLFCQANTARQSNTPAAKALHHSGRCAACGAITHAITPSKNRVSRVSRGRLTKRWRTRAQAELEEGDKIAIARKDTAPRTGA